MGFLNCRSIPFKLKVNQINKPCLLSCVLMWDFTYYRRIHTGLQETNFAFSLTEIKGLCFAESVSAGCKDEIEASMGWNVFSVHACFNTALLNRSENC